MTLISIRRAVEADQETIGALVRSAAVNPRDIRWPRFLVAEEEGGSVVGIQQIRTHRGGTRELASRVVRPGFRRRGVGSKLLRAHLAEESGPLYLQCGEGWVPYYEKFGFRRIAPSELPADLRREHIIGRFFVAARSLYLRRRLRIVPMKRDLGDRWTPSTNAQREARYENAARGYVGR